MVEVYIATSADPKVSEIWYQLFYHTSYFVTVPFAMNYAPGCQKYMYMSRNTFMFNISFWVCVLHQLWSSASLVLCVHHCNLHSDLNSSVLNTIEGGLFNTNCICQLLPAVLQNPFLKVLTNYLEKVEAYYEEVWELSILILHSWQ